ncbi:hypothetical protein IW262DRAFT_1492221 [Armillaria fumosa]|nr:hypothetical protein IW262DRAFT_1492221 [Armillaria fumosa]
MKIGFMTPIWSKNLEIISTYCSAALLSAVVTTLVAQTSQSLQPDYAAMSASLLYESVLVERAIVDGSPVNTISSSLLSPSITVASATTDVWVNGPFLSLTTALNAILLVNSVMLAFKSGMSSS